MPSKDHQDRSCFYSITPPFLTVQESTGTQLEDSEACSDFELHGRLSSTTDYYSRSAVASALCFCTDK